MAADGPPLDPPRLGPPPRPAAGTSPPSRSRLLKQFGIGLIWFVLLAVNVTILTGTHVLIVLSAMLAVSLVVGGLTIWWLAERVSQADFRPGRFSIASLMLFMVFVGGFLALVRWLVLATAARNRHIEPISAFVFLVSGVGTLLVCLISVQLVAGMLDSLVWWAIGWLRRRRP